MWPVFIFFQAEPQVNRALALLHSGFWQPPTIMEAKTTCHSHCRTEGTSPAAGLLGPSKFQALATPQGWTIGRPLFHYQFQWICAEIGVLKRFPLGVPFSLLVRKTSVGQYSCQLICQYWGSPTEKGLGPPVPFLTPFLGPAKINYRKKKEKNTSGTNLF